MRAGSVRNASDRVIGVLDLAGPVVHRAIRRRLDHAFAAPARTSPPSDLFVVHDPAHISLRTVPYPPPVPGRLGQRRLEQVLGGVLVAGQDVGGPLMRLSERVATNSVKARSWSGCKRSPLVSHP